MASSQVPRAETLLANLLSTRRVDMRQALEDQAPVPVNPGKRYRCKKCRDSKRVKVPKTVGTTEPCGACSAPATK